MGISSPSGTTFADRKLDSRLSYGENSESLSHLGLNRYRVVTDGRTDRTTIANTRLAVPAVSRKNLSHNLCPSAVFKSVQLDRVN